MLLLLLASSTERTFDLFVKLKTPFPGCACLRNKKNGSQVASSRQNFQLMKMLLGPLCLSSPGESWCPGEAAATGAESAKRCSSSLFFWHFQDSALTFSPRQSGFWHEYLCNQTAILGTSFIWNPSNSFCMCTLKSSCWLMESVWMPLGNLLTAC